jgi:Zn-dependent protease
LSSFVAFVIAAIALVPAILVAIPAHELGHALTAYFLGDRSVRYFGQLSYNPRRLLDPLGAIAVLIALVGWGRRVPVQSNRINTKGRRVLYELGGPAANLIVGIVLGLVLRGLFAAGVGLSLSFSVGLIAFFVYAIWFLNLSIMAFQLLPVPGLDGWNIVEALVRDRNPRFFFDVSARRREIWIGAVVILVLFQLFQGANLLALVMSPFYTPASLISLGQCGGYAIPGLNGLNPCLPWGR